MQTLVPAHNELDLQRLNHDLADLSPLEIVQSAVDTFGERLAVQSSMQKTAGVLMHLISRVAPDTEIIFVDTGVHFMETLDVRDEFVRRFGLKIKTYKPELSFDQQYNEYGHYLHEVDDTKPGAAAGYTMCCRLRKELPFIAAVRGRFDAIISGLMREEGGARGGVDIITWDSRIEACKINPLAHWSGEQVDAYTAAHELPVHPLYAKGYPSTGCWTCTTPIQPGEDKRAGRWRHIRESDASKRSAPIYCGINFEDRGSGI
ncbi:MAG: phosphoadenylyl-sulfate reductase [Candidatus Sumerlaeaceae bacterium]